MCSIDKYSNSEKIAPKKKQKLKVNQGNVAVFTFLTLLLTWHH